MSEHKKIPVILDGDPGHDDAIAWVLAKASPKLDIRAVTTCAGNQTLEKTTYNARRICTLLGIDAPIAMGLHHPLFSDPITAGNIHGQSGLDGPALPEPAVPLSDLSAVELMAKVLRESEDKVVIIATGPETNVAALLLAHPELKEKIAGISVMGGGIAYGNWTAAAEFNIWADPEAAQIVMDSGCPIRIIPLDATHRACINADESKAFRALGTPVGKAVADCVDHRILAYSHLQPMERLDSAPIHDALAVCAVVHPEVITKSIFTRVDIDISGGLADGQTIVDPRTYTDRPRNADFALDADRDLFARWMMACIQRFEG